VGLDGRDIVRLLGLLVGRPPQPKQKPEEQLPVSGHAENVQCLLTPSGNTNNAET
jgi:hypothetical protein